MTGDVVITDGTNAMTLPVDHWTYDMRRMPKEFTLKSLPPLGVAKSVTTDFGSFTEFYSLQGKLDTRANAEQLVDYSKTEWFVNRPITVTIPALSTDDDAVDFTTVSGTEAIITMARVQNDLDTDGVASFPFQIDFAVCKRL